MPITSIVLFLHLILYLTTNVFNKRYFLWILKNLKILFSCGQPVLLITQSGTCEFRLDSSCLFYLCKFTVMVRTKCSFPAFCMDYKAKFTDWSKTSETSQAWSHMFLNLCHNSFHTKGRPVWMVDQNSSKFECFQKL